jgi:hypothetical protein
MEAWSSRLGVGRWTNNPALQKGYCHETPKGEARASNGLLSHMMMNSNENYYSKQQYKLQWNCE